MSNIAKITEFLKEKENRFITITNLSTNSLIGEDKTYYKDLSKGDLANYIKFHLGPLSVPVGVQIETRSDLPDGKSKKENSCTIQVNPDNYQQTASVEIPQTPTAPMIPTVQPQTGNQGTFGLGFADILTLHGDASEGKRAVKDLTKKEKEHDDLKRKFDFLEDEHRALKTEHSVLKAASEKEKELAVMFAKMESKGFMDSEAAQSIIKEIPSMLASFAAIKGGALPAVPMLGAPAASEIHDQFTNFMNDNLNESQVEFLMNVTRFLNNEMFVKEANSLIQKYSTNV